jgi:protein TonB
VVDAEGKVVSYSMAGGSGSAALAAATLEMIRRNGRHGTKADAELLSMARSKSCTVPSTHWTRR